MNVMFSKSEINKKTYSNKSFSTILVEYIRANIAYLNMHGHFHQFYITFTVL